MQTKNVIVSVLLTAMLSSGITAWLVASEANYAQSNMPSVTAGSFQAGRALIHKIANNEIEVLDQFDAGGDLYGFVIKSSKQPETAAPSLIYTDKSGQTLISGTVMINEKGENISERDFFKYIQPEQATSAYQTIAKTAFIEQGQKDAPHKLYAVIDPNCPHCKTFFKKVQPKIESGELAVRWIMVANSGANAEQKAYTVYASQTPIEVLKALEADEDVALIDNPPMLAISKLKTNKDFVMASKLIYTPTLFYLSKEGIKQVHSGGLADDKLEALIDSSADQF